ncbi:DNA polymerase I [Colwellia sp. 4_MG-2023]|jgi:DNA polymerase-1|uniref:DNA polymerase I n=1 Tax=unclassified Colwellia TaxID=196834 RepID=UPI001C0A2DF3|nr:MULTISPECIES: DNA polymerase I [unclassified Colwellia]MBU2923640.1 DNA polymerase I [Colwellia sp. C2M11]MDO6505837.1 DNA polymerase I [Colwellia sp. 5_MG-2023]MDO6554518.1 DNA polymerase I [Colwellia sp. 4_MG-2023]MDO6652260.1 DNA polymerase I [Colwellia sp. 3_MG-2023]MDO6664571.1 DNA polymerase I [Colwellia sp. 2_MG-2023]
MTTSTENSPLSPLILVDGSSYLFRAYHVPYLQALSTASGQPTGAITGVLNMIRSLKKDYPNGNVVVIFDAKGKTFRNDLYPEYKANRPPMPDELRTQIAPLHNIISAMGLPLLVIPGVEADDVIGTLAKQASEQGIETVISTGDKDMAQLVTPHVRLINTMTAVELDEAGVSEKFGVRPDQIIDYLALMGDKVDNIPGVVKCGPKTAVKWLTEHGTLDEVIANADKVKGKIGENLREALDQLPLSYLLATIKCDVELEQSVEQLQPTEPDVEALTSLYQEFELKRLLADLGKESGNSKSEQVVSSSINKASKDSVIDTPISKADQVDVTSTEVSDAKYDIILDKISFNAWLEKLKGCTAFAFDTETTSVDYMKAELVGLSFAIESGIAAYVPLAHDYIDAPYQLDLDWVLAQLKPLLESTEIKKIGQNLKYDANVLSHYDIQLQGAAFDTMLESYCYNSVATRHNMDALSLKYLDYKTVSFEDVAGKGAKQLTFNQIDIEKAGYYAAEDADITLRLHQAIFPALEQLPEQLSVYNEIEMPLMPVLAKMEQTGVLIDCDVLDQQSHSIGQRLNELEIEAHNLAGKSFNLGSPKQLQQILFEELKIPVIKKTPKGAPSTAEEVLQELALDYPLPKVILENRGLSKLKSTYTDKLPLMVSTKTGRVHTSYHQAVTATGRLSSTDPNLQNIPIRSEQGRKIRQAFIAPTNYKIVAIDYSQIELRIMAHLSNDKGLVTAFSEGKDIHKATAAEIFSVELDEVTTDQRRSAKAINFGLIYGMSAFGLAKQLGIGRQQAQEYQDKYFQRYPGVLTYMEETREQASEQGYVETLYGRRLYLPEIKSKNGMRRKGAERAAINAPMQGTAADIIKKAMLDVSVWLNEKNDDRVKMTMQVHDELIFEIHQDIVEEVTAKLVDLMNNAVTLSVPLIAEAGVGDNWDEAH